MRPGSPRRIDRYLLWSADVPAPCRLTTVRVDEGAALPDEPIVDAKVLEYLPKGSWLSPSSLGNLLAVSNCHSGKLLPESNGQVGNPLADSGYALLLTLTVFGYRG